MTVTDQGKHFAICNNARCRSTFLVDPAEDPGELGHICPRCNKKTLSHHVVQCSSCGTVVNMVRASDAEEKVTFNVDKCSHCGGTVEDEWNIEPLYFPDSYI
ncbi:MAG: hypothetical protein HRU80_05300 [Ignavibacteriales bacterium]|nr:hypothetical protein [Ignavibacteriaceae bacterium]MCK6614048.1 formate dehydrogenase accessory protein FdhE [Ignavibacteriaceae bacterium]QOJ28324.1 MAG: hypothetical protein HRU80_05300 [Ignavibacteriales bacterium]